MRSRSVRLSCVVVAWIALAVTAFFIVRAEQQLAARQADLRTFDVRARAITVALSDLRSAQQAYVAAGQGVSFWTPKVAQTGDALLAAVATLRASATSPGAREAIDETRQALTRFDEVDTRAHEYLRAGQVLMASDMIFSEGSEIAAAAAESVNAAQIAEGQALETLEAAVRKQEGVAMGLAAGATAMIALLLGLTTGALRDVEDTTTGQVATNATKEIGGPSPIPMPAPARSVSPVLKAAAQLCTDFACMQDVHDLQLLLTRASDVMDASGIIVWLGNSRGDDLQPVLTHGYSEEIRARLPNVPRSAGNAAAAAYRSGDLQIVLSKPGGTKGAIVAPIRGPQGCIGALSVEIRGGGEASEGVQSLATIVAAQLAGVLAAPQTESEHREARAAASS